MWTKYSKVRIQNNGVTEYEGKTSLKTSWNTYVRYLGKYMTRNVVESIVDGVLVYDFQTPAIDEDALLRRRCK